ncbi:MAG TPA: hypothetical protein VML19_10705 [Verrucomicrobiae bacterium]|nr:hypothetical protein [Verrucomicrobiae bacterium]
MRRLLCALFACLLPTAGTAATMANLPNTGINAVQADSAGNILVAGYQGSMGSAATYDAFVMKLSPDGTKVLYSTRLAGSKSDIASALALDATGAVYVFGQTQSPDFPVTPGAMQATFQAPPNQGQGFAAKLDPQGNVVYATYIGGTAEVGPGGAIGVDAAGDAYITGQTDGGGFPTTPGAAVASTATNSWFVMKLDPTGKLLAAARGAGGLLMALDSQDNVYVTAADIDGPGDVPITPGAFQSTYGLMVCGGDVQLAFGCGYQFVTKLNSSLTQVVYSTYIAGRYGAVPAAISVDAQGNALVAGATNSPDYPTTPNAFQPYYLANAPPGPSVGLFGPIYPPPASGYITKLNAAGTGQLYSTYFSGSQTDTVSFAAITTGGIYFAGRAGSADLPGLEVPQPCLPETYVTRMSLDGSSVTAAHIVNGTVLAWDEAASAILTWNGSQLVSFDPSAPPPAISCILDAADQQPVTAIAPGELLSIYGPHFLNGAESFPPGQFPRSVLGISVNFNSLAGPLLYVGAQQINVQAPFEISGSSQVTVGLTLPPTAGVADSMTMPVVAMNPAAFLNLSIPLYSLDTCPLDGLVYNGGPLPLAFNSDGTVNTCTNPAAAGSTVAVLIQGLGLTGPAVTGGINATPGAPLTLPVTATSFGATNVATVVSANALAGSPSGIWQIGLQIARNNDGAIPISLAVGSGSASVAVRDANLTIWMK